MAKDDIVKHQFQPGQSGNPAGRPPGIPNSATRMNRILNLIEKQTNPVNGKIEEFTVAELLDLQQIIKARKGDTKAYTVIMERLEGRPAQSIDHTTAGKPMTFIVNRGGDGTKPTDTSN
jgi:hypothetical protein